MSPKTILSSAPPGARTLDTLIKSQVLYQLSWRCISVSLLRLPQRQDIYYHMIFKNASTF